MRFDSRWSVLMLVGALGCASSGGSSTTGETAATPPATTATNATIRIDNNRPTGSDVTVFIVPESGGIRSSLGTVQANSMAAFTYSAQSGYYTLEATSGTGNTQSRRFRLTNGQVASWNMSTGDVIVSNRR
ncbi:MAG: hypothetical protein ACRENP_26625 [Longimicrobiales bacterium]